MFIFSLFLEYDTVRYDLIEEFVTLAEKLSVITDQLNLTDAPQTQQEAKLSLG